MAIGLARRPDDRLLAMRVLDDSGSLHGVRPPGGGVEFGERTEDALIREFREEFGCEIGVEGAPIVFENLFRFHEAIGHEIIFAYPVRLLDQRLYAHDTLTLTEDNGAVLGVDWVPLADLRSGRIALFPEGLLARLA